MMHTTIPEATQSLSHQKLILSKGLLLMFSSFLRPRAVLMAGILTSVCCLFSGAATAQAAEPDYTGAFFGSELTCAGDVNGDGYDDVLVAAHTYSNNTGKAFLYNGSAKAPSVTPDWEMTGSATDEWYGQRMAGGDFNNDGYSDIAIGARGYGEDNGKVTVYLGSANGPQAAVHWSKEGNLTHSVFGYDVATGDVNGDGYDDLIVGAPSDQSNATDTWEGLVYVYAGSQNGLSKTPLKILEGNLQYSRFGAAVATADVNGDDIDDILVGAFQWKKGLAAVFHGSKSSIASVANWTAEGTQSDSRFAYFVKSAGDVNRDGYDDVLVSAYSFDITSGSSILANAGEVYLYHGSASGLGAVPAWTGQGSETNANFGSSIGGAGDVNEDGYDDVLISLYTPTGTPPNAGRATVYLGSATGLKKQPAWTKDADQDAGYYGNGAIGACDLNQDAVADIVVAAYRYDDQFVDEGRIWGYKGSKQGLQSTAFWTTGPSGASAEDPEAGVYLPCMLSEE